MSVPDLAQDTRRQIADTTWSWATRERSRWSSAWYHHTRCQCRKPHIKRVGTEYDTVHQYRAWHSRLVGAIMILYCRTVHGMASAYAGTTTEVSQKCREIASSVLRYSKHVLLYSSTGHDIASATGGSTATILQYRAGHSECLGRQHLSLDKRLPGDLLVLLLLARLLSEDPSPATGKERSDR